MTTQEQVKKKRGSLLAKAAVISIIMAAAAILLSGTVLYMLFRQRAIENMNQTLTQDEEILNSGFYRYSAYSWLLDYWKEHGQEMELPPYRKDFERYSKQLEQAWEQFKEIDLQHVTPETLESKSLTDSLSVDCPKNELGQLSDDLILMGEEMDLHIQKVEIATAEKERIGAELNVASKIQLDMLPSDFPVFTERKEIDIYASSTPAKEVGGDFYDFFLIDEDHLCMVMADVSGKGIPAALFMMFSKIILADHALPRKTPSQILTEANNAQKELFGSGRMLAALNRDAKVSPEQILKNVRSTVDEFVGAAEQFDDLTMLCIEYKGKGD